LRQTSTTASTPSTIPVDQAAKGMESVKSFARRHASLPKSINLDGLKQYTQILTVAVWAVNCCGLFILFISLCVLESKVPAFSIGLLWWTLCVHLGCSGVWSLKIFAPAQYRCWSRHLEALQPLEFMSAILMMLLCDRSVQIAGWGSVWTAS
jgi:hypothetical protein